VKTLEVFICLLNGVIGHGRNGRECTLVAERAEPGASGRAALTLINDRRATCDDGAARADFACLSDFISECEGPEPRHACLCTRLTSPLVPSDV